MELQDRQQTPDATDDYRRSHLGKGEIYDDELRSEPLAKFTMDQERSILARIVPRLFPAGVPRYLDFACGTGRITEQIEPMASESFGVDISADMLEQAALKCARTRFFCIDLTREAPPVRDASLVTAFRFFGNAQPQLRREALQAIRSVLRPGGYLILNNHRNPWALHQIALTMTGVASELDLSPRKLKALLREEGFRIEQAYGIAAWFLRYSLDRTEVMRSSLVSRLERLSRHVPAICPDSVLVARRVS